MNDLAQPKPTTIDGIKRLARQIKAQAQAEGREAVYGHCLEQAAKQAGFKTFAAAKHSLPLN